MKLALTGSSLHLPHEFLRLFTRPAAIACWLIGAMIGLTACGRGSAPSGPETGPVAKLVPVAGTPAAVVALLPGGRGCYSPGGFNSGGTGWPIASSSANLKCIHL